MCLSQLLLSSLTTDCTTQNEPDGVQSEVEVIGDDILTKSASATKDSKYVAAEDFAHIIESCKSEL